MDTYGNPVYFREGVSEKRIITKLESKLDTCNRFKYEKSCNDEMSYSIDGLKCKWSGNRCDSIHNLITITGRDELKDIWNYVPDDEDIRELWDIALLSSKNYIQLEMSGKNLGEDYLNELVIEQSMKLKQYIDDLNKKYKKYRTPIVNAPDNDLLELIPPIKPRATKWRDEPIPGSGQDGMILMSIRTVVPEGIKRKLTLLEIDNLTTYYHHSYGNLNILGRETVDDTHIVLATRGDNDNIIKIPAGKLFEYDGLTIKTKNIFVYISQVDKKYLENPINGFEWILDELDHVTGEKTTKVVNHIDTRTIKPTGEYNGTHVITRQDIDASRTYLAFSKFLDTSDRLILIDKINASPLSIEFSLSNGISLLDDKFSRIIREITVDDVVDKIGTMLKRPMSKSDKMKTDLELASTRGDKKEMQVIKAQYKKVAEDLPQIKDLKPKKYKSPDSTTGNLSENKEKYMTRLVMRVPRLTDE
jgi:hypothetical protein